MSTVLLLLMLGQLQDLVTWTDPAGVVHVSTVPEAPRSARPLKGGSYSVIDQDGRPLVMPDGGTRHDDDVWWRTRFAEARQAVEVSRDREEALARGLAASEREVCATARAEAVAVARTPFDPKKPFAPRASLEQRTVSVHRQCARGLASPQAREELVLRKMEREQAERALRRLEEEALANNVPLRDWR